MRLFFFFFLSFDSKSTFWTSLSLKIIVELIFILMCGFGFIFQYLFGIFAICYVLVIDSVAFLIHSRQPNDKYSR